MARLMLRNGAICAVCLGLALASSPCLAGTPSDEKREAYALSDLAPLAARSALAIVTIRSWDIRQEPQTVGPESGFPDPPTMRELRGAGIVIDAAAGLIVTANHMVANGAVEALLQDGRTLTAIPLARSERDDIALLRVAAGRLPAALALADGGNVRVGDFVLAIGDPMDLGPSVTFGIVSALHRSCPGIGNADLIQSDALVEQGSSGGALVDMQGRVIGVIVARYGGAQRAFGFAVPVDAIRKLLASVQ